LVHPGFVWVPPKIRASPNFRATAQAGTETAAPCDSRDGDPQETQQDLQVAMKTSWIAVIAESLG